MDISTRQHGLARPVPARAAWPWWVLRAGVVVQALLTFAQPILAGRFLAGDVASLDVHQLAGMLVGTVALLQIVTTLLAWRLGGASGRLVVGAAVLAAAAVGQIYAGTHHVLGIHVPLGVAIVVATIRLLGYVWRHGPRGTR